VRSLPYDRDATTMASWAMDDTCAGEYHDPASRRFHAEPVACAACGPHYRLREDDETDGTDDEAVRRAARLLRAGAVVAVKGLGGYHLACDAANRDAVARLRERKF